MSDNASDFRFVLLPFPTDYRAPVCYILPVEK